MQGGGAVEGGVDVVESGVQAGAPGPTATAWPSRRAGMSHQAAACTGTRFAGSASLAFELRLRALLLGQPMRLYAVR